MAGRYIKREWKNGKWVYTYPEDVKKAKKQYKYIKREWKNGKWVYTYPEDLEKEEKQKASTKTSLVDKVKNLLAKNGSEKVTKASKSSTASDFANKYKKTGESVVKKASSLLSSSVKSLSNLISIGEKKAKKYKYIKREWKNGRWVYTYPEDIKDDSSDEKKTPEPPKQKEAARKKYEENMKNLAEKTEREKREAEERSNAVHAAAQRRKEIAPFQKELDKNLKELEKNNPLPDLPLKKEPMTYAEDQAVINPNYDPSNDETSRNCALCTVAYDLRRRGYDVKANEQVSDINALKLLEMYGSDVFGLNTMSSAYKAATGKEHKGEWTREEALNVLETALLKEGEGARGDLGLYWSQGGAHSVVWEIENNKVVIRDAQTNKTYNFDDYEYWSYLSKYDYTRLDDKTPTEDVLKYVQAR